MGEQTIKFGVDIDFRGIDQSIRSTQRLLYFTNSLRLTIVDFQKLLEKPSLETAFWAALQLSYVWTNLIRMIRQFNMMSKGGGGTVGTIMDLMGGSIGGGMGGGSGGNPKKILPWVSNMGLINFARTSTGPGLMERMMGNLTGLVMANPMATGVMVAALLLGGGIMLQRKAEEDLRQNARNMARAQGLEY